jgi:hypothetical protein
MPKFTYEQHVEKMKEILNQKPQQGQAPSVLQKLINKAKTRSNTTTNEEVVQNG